MSFVESESQINGAAAGTDPGEVRESLWRIEVGGRIDRHSAEILFLELRRLVVRHGGAVKEFTIKKE